MGGGEKSERQDERRRQAAEFQKKKVDARQAQTRRWTVTAGVSRAGEAREVEDEMNVKVGEKFVGAVAKESQVMGMNFQVAAVKKALAAVWRMCRARNVVQFGDREEDCCVKVGLEFAVPPSFLFVRDQCHHCPHRRHK